MTEQVNTSTVQPRLRWLALSATQKKILILGLVLLLTGGQLLRIIDFVSVYGGMDHDSGWFLSVSRSLAERGEYTTLVSTIINPDVTGAPNIDQKFNIQTDDGRIWFFTGNGNGPVSIVFNAVVLKIFGFDFWALRTGPLIFYTCFLLLSAYILYRLSGLGAVLLFYAFIFFYPHISIFLGYEAMGEVPSMVFILLTYLAFTWAITRPKKRTQTFFVAGLFAGLALNTKLITLWSLGGVFGWAAFLWVVGFSQWGRQFTASRIKFSEFIWLSVGIPLTLFLWELVQLLILSRLAGLEGYQQHLWQRIGFILDDGSGVGLQIHSGPEFFWDKFFLLSEVTHPQRWVVAVLFVSILLGTLWLLRQWKQQAMKQNLLAVIWLGWFINTAWFVGLAKTGWVRHFWLGLVLAVLLLCVVTVDLLRRYKDRSTSSQGAFVTGLVLLALIGWGFLSQPHVWGFFIQDKIVPYWQAKQIGNKYNASLPWLIVPRADQEEVVEYIKQMPFEAHVYYPAGRKTVEIPPQTGRIQYPLQRREFVASHEADVAIIGPSLIAPWMDPDIRRVLQDMVREECPSPILENDYYMICPIPSTPND